MQWVLRSLSLRKRWNENLSFQELISRQIFQRSPQRPWNPDLQATLLRTSSVESNDNYSTKFIQVQIESKRDTMVQVRGLPRQHRFSWEKRLSSLLCRRVPGSQNGTDDRDVERPMANFQIYPSSTYHGLYGSAHCTAWNVRRLQSKKKYKTDLDRILSHRVRRHKKLYINRLRNHAILDITCTDRYCGPCTTYKIIKLFIKTRHLSPFFFPRRELQATMCVKKSPSYPIVFHIFHSHSVWYRWFLFIQMSHKICLSTRKKLYVALRPHIFETESPFSTLD